MKQMRALVIEAAGKLPVFKQIPIPQPRDGQVLVKVDSAPINPSDLAFLQGSYSSEKKYPCVPGFEGSGTVVQSGGGLLGWKITGKKVAFYADSDFGSYAEYAVVGSNSCLELDNDMNLKENCCAFVNPVTILAMLELVQSRKVPAVVHTAAASQLGRMMIRHFQQHNVKVINVVRREAQVEILKKEGATIILNQSEEGFLQKLQKVCEEQRATIFFDAIGGPITGQILGAMPIGSTAYVYGGLGIQPVSDVGIMDLIFKKKKVEGFFLTQYLESKNILSLVMFVRNLKQLLRTNLRTIIAKEFSLEDFRPAVSYYLKNMSEGKVLIRPCLTGTQQQESETQDMAQIVQEKFAVKLDEGKMDEPLKQIVEAKSEVKQEEKVEEKLEVQPKDPNAPPQGQQ